MYDTYIVFRIQNGSIDLVQAYGSTIKVTLELVTIGNDES